MQHLKRWLFLLGLLGAVCLTGISFAQSGSGYGLSWSTFDGGGNTTSGSGYSLSGTVGQPDATSFSAGGGDYALVSGFWSGGSAGPAPVLTELVFLPAITRP